MRPFDRRGLLQLDATWNGVALTVVATSFARDRASRVRDVRFARTVLRSVSGIAIAFVANAAESRIGFSDLGFVELARDDHNLIVVRPSQATPPPQTAGSHDASASMARI